jgi:hypothetical protein
MRAYIPAEKSSEPRDHEKVTIMIQKTQPVSQKIDTGIKII